MLRVLAGLRINGRRQVEVTAYAVRTFFDEHLKGGPDSRSCWQRSLKSWWCLSEARLDGLVPAQRRHRIDSRGALCGQQRGEQRDADEERARTDERNGVARLDAEQQRGEVAGAGERGGRDRARAQRRRASCPVARRA